MPPTEIPQKQMMNLLITVSSTSLLKTEKQKRGVLEEKSAKTLSTVLKKMYTFESKYSRIWAVSLGEPDNAAGGLQPISSAGICFFVQAGKG